MRRFASLGVVCLLLSGTAAAGSLQRTVSGPQRSFVDGLRGLRMASSADLEKAAAKTLTLSAETGHRPAVLLETDYYVYEGSDTPTVRLSLDPNGSPNRSKG